MAVLFICVKKKVDLHPLHYIICFKKQSYTYVSKGKQRLYDGIFLVRVSFMDKEPDAAATSCSIAVFTIFCDAGCVL